MSLRVSRNQKVNLVKAELARGMRKQPTLAEAILWQELRGRKLLGYKFRRQQVLFGLIADFYCEQADLAIEIDGSVHASTDARAKDLERDQLFVGAGILTLKFTNQQVVDDCESVLSQIADALTLRAPSSLRNGERRGPITPEGVE